MYLYKFLNVRFTIGTFSMVTLFVGHKRAKWKVAIYFWFIFVFFLSVFISFWNPDHCSKHVQLIFDPLTPMSDQDRIPPYNINQISDENKEKCQFGDN